MTLPNQSFSPMVEVTRGERVESLHRGAIAVVDADGRLVGSWGNPAEPVYVRSSAKPFQALALVCSGAADAYGITEEELAVVCGSHSGEPQHVQLVRSVLHKAGLGDGDLRCGIHPPFDPGVRRTLALSGEEPNPLHNNCSGKHAGMLAAARYLGLPTASYVDPEHDIQIAIRGLLAFLAGLETDEVGLAVDGCAVPTFHVPLRGFALAMARLAAVGEGLEMDSLAPAEGEDDLDGEPYEPDEDEPEGPRRRAPQTSLQGSGEGAEDAPSSAPESASDDDQFPVPVPEALERIWTAMKNHPVLIAGSRRRLCTDLMRVAGPMGIPLVAKSGAEGVYAMAVVQRGQAFGIALKVEDGAERARNAAALETLFQLGLLPGEAREALAGYHHPVVRTLRDEPVGEVRPHFRLNRGLPG
jgi:L-asparaginase II